MAKASGELRITCELKLNRTVRFLGEKKGTTK
jgi:hypothetical protein